MAREQRVERCCEAEDIASRVAGRSAEPDQLRRSPGAGSCEEVRRVLLRLLVCNESPREARHSETARVGDDDAVGRDAPMQNASRVRLGEEVCHHAPQIGHGDAR